MAMRNGYDSDHGESSPHYQQGMSRGLYTYCYTNGDEYSSAKKILVNPKRDRTFTAYLDYVTKVLNPRFGAVRAITTPTGRNHVRSFSDLQPGGHYVACGAERYKKLDRPYTQIDSSSPRRRNRSKNSYDRLQPGHHNKMFESVHSKFSEVPIQGKNIELFFNGKVTESALRIGLQPSHLISWHSCIKELRNRCADRNYRLEELYDTEGNLITDVRQIENGHQYVAKDKTGIFDRGPYNPNGMKNMMVPVHSPRSQPRYLWKERTLPPIQKKNSPDHSVSSYPETRKRNQVNGVPQKPAKHTKRNNRQADYDKAKDEKIRKDKQSKAATKIQANYRGHQARKEVAEKKQQKQEEETKKKTDAANVKRTAEEHQAATKIQAGFRGHQARKEIQEKKQK